MKDKFLTIASAAEGIYKEKGSKFLAFAYPVNDEQEIKDRISMLRKKYFDARHHCYAYRLGVGGERYRANDDGEPSNSAGQPILGQLLANNLTNTLVVVVRYFGGTLLGVGGLMQAYKQATVDALANAQVVTGIVVETYQFQFDYADVGQVLKIIKEMNLEYSEQSFNFRCSIKVKIRKNLVEQMKQRFGIVESLTMERED